MEEQNNTPGITPNDPQTPPATPTPPEANGDKVSFTPEQQAVLDKILAREAEKAQRRTEKRLQELQEAERLKNMSESERAAAELESARKTIAEYERQQLVNQYTIELTSKGLPKEFAEIIPAGDADQAKKAIDTLSGYRSSIEKPLQDKIAQLETELKNANLRGPAPKIATMTKTDLDALGDTEFFRRQRELKKQEKQK